MRKRYRAISCSSGWLDMKFMMVSVAVGFWKILTKSEVGFLVIDRSKLLTLFLDSRVGLSWLLLWMVLMYCSIFIVATVIIYIP